MTKLDRPCFAIYADSNAANAYGFSYHERALGPSPYTSNAAVQSQRYPSLRICAAGGGAGAAAIAGSPLASLVDGCNVLIYAMSTNNYGSTASAIADLVNKDIAVFRRRGIERVIGCTGPPTTASTDSWTSTANQTPHTPDETHRVGFNEMYRAGLIDVDAVCDATTFVEVNQAGQWVKNGGVWRVVAGVPFGDNVHYRDDGHAAAAVGQAQVIDRVVAGEKDFIVQNPLLIG